MKILQRVADRLIAISERRSPDFVIGGEERPYLRRWFLIPKNRFFNIYLHHICRSDDDRALHNHPWINLSILLRGAYLEVTPKGTIMRLRGDFILRGTQARHRLQLLSPLSVPPFLKTYPLAFETWTLFITGPWMRPWGFDCPQGFVPWQDFTAPGAEGEIGKGCDQ
jgi:hypothetical protein